MPTFYMICSIVYNLRHRLEYGQNKDIRTSQQRNQLANIATDQSYTSPNIKKGRHLYSEKRIKKKHTDLSLGMQGPMFDLMRNIF